MLKVIPFKLTKIHLPGMCQICAHASQIFITYSFLTLELCENCAQKLLEKES